MASGMSRPVPHYHRPSATAKFWFFTGLRGGAGIEKEWKTDSAETGRSSESLLREKDASSSLRFSVDCWWVRRRDLIAKSDLGGTTTNHRGLTKSRGWWPVMERSAESVCFSCIRSRSVSGLCVARKLAGTRLVLSDLRKHRHYEMPSERRKRKMTAAQRKTRRNTRFSRD